MSLRSTLLILATLAVSGVAAPALAGSPRPPATDPHENPGHLTFASPQSNPIALSPDGSWGYVANTTSNSVTIFATSTMTSVREVPVGLEPVSIAVRPDGSEVWVSNHVSDSVSVIDVSVNSATYGQVVETVQALDTKGRTLFDEPVGIAFASNSKAYVALSSRNEIAIVDADAYQVTGFIAVRAQEPRAIAVRNGLLYVASMESGNQTELSACVTATGGVGSQCSLDLNDLFAFATDPNLPTQIKNIVVDPDVPDRDLFVYDTTTDQEVAAVTGVGTLLYGLAVSSTGQVFIAQTNALNALNGNDGDVLATLGNHLFDNQIARLNCSSGGCSGLLVQNLEPAGGTTHANALATPYGIALDEANAHVLVTAAASSRVASFPTSLAGSPLSVVDVGATPRGIAFRPGSSGGTAYVLSTLDNRVTEIGVAANGVLSLARTLTVGNDPTPAAVRRGRIAFESAFASNSGNFACASCHPDGNTDQLLWRIGGACPAIGCGNGDEPRTTMPIRGLKNTLPLHWDGSLGDPFGGPNGAVGLGTSLAPSCNAADADGDHDCFADLVQASLSGVMCAQPCTTPELSSQERDDMATFLASVSYPPARSRRIDDSLSRSGEGVMLGNIEVSARQGFSDFFTNVDGANTQPRTCADADGGCHALPLGTSTNSATLQGFDAPTMRGLTDRYLQFSMGPTAAEELLVFANTGLPGFLSPLETPIRWTPSIGLQEITTFGVAFGVFQPTYGVRPLDLFQSFEEASTGLSGATGRQLTLNTATANLPETLSLMNALQAADTRGVVNLRALGRRNGASITLSYRASGNYETGSTVISPAALRSEAAAGTTLVTLIADLRSATGSLPQPLLATAGAITTGNVGDPPLPTLASSGGDPPPFNATGTDVKSTASVFLDGALASGATVVCTPNASGFCPNGTLSIDLAVRPTAGLHLVQVQNPAGELSNELPLCVGSAAGCLTD